MLKRALQAVAILVVCGVAIFFIFGSTNIKIDATAEKVGKNIVITYNVENKSIAPLTLFKDNKEETFLEIGVYNSNKRPLRVGLENPTGEHKVGVLTKEGEGINTFKTIHRLDTTLYNGRISEALYLKLKLRVNKDHIKDPFERFISFLRKGRVSSEMVLIN